MKKTKILANGAAVDIYSTDTSHPKYMIYLHGGGLIYGSKSDLPENLTQVFLKHGYTVLALDYLLAPNSQLADIIASLAETFQLLKDELIQQQPFSLCGRSAGGYLMVQLTKHLVSQQLSPTCLINFYGYTDLTFITQQRPLQLKQITTSAITAIDQKTPLWDDPFLSRYLLYHYACQHQLLAKFYGLSETSDWTAYSVTAEELRSFPPCFSTASSSDEEVPFRYSKFIGRFIPESTFSPVYYLQHDFLKQPQETQVVELFQKLDQWLTTQNTVKSG